jgi:hypothetical protein
LHADRDVCKGSTDTPKDATPRAMETLKLDKMVLQQPAPIARSEDGKQGKKKQNPTWLSRGSMSGQVYLDDVFVL